jgi:hypothetical protein
MPIRRTVSLLTITRPEQRHASAHHRCEPARMVSGWPYTVSYARSGGSRAAGKVALREDQPSHRAICAIAAWEAGGALRAITNGALATKRISLRSTGQRRLLLESSSNARMGRLRSQGFVSGGEENRLPNPKRPPARLVPSFAPTSACTQPGDFYHAQRLPAGPRGYKAAMP